MATKINPLGITLYRPVQVDNANNIIRVGMYHSKRIDAEIESQGWDSWAIVKIQTWEI